MSKKHTPSFPRSCVGMQTETNPSQGMGSHAGAWEPDNKKKALVPELRFPEFIGADEWKEKPLNKISEIVMGSSPKSSAYNESGIGLPLLQGNADIKNRLSTPTIFTSQITKECGIGDILLSVRAPVGTVAKSNHNACIGRGLSAIRAFSDNCQEFIYQWLLYFEPLWSDISQGGTFDAVNSDDIRNLLAPVPEKEEQQKIANCLSSIDDLITAQARKTEALKAHKKGLMQQLFPREGETVPRVRFPEFLDVGEWEEIDIGSIGKVSMCKRILKSETKVDGDIPFYKIGTFGKQADAYISKETYEDYKSKYSYPKKGDILISASGTIGRLVVFNGVPAYFQDSNIVWIDNYENLVKNSFLFYCYENIKWATDDNTISRLYNDNLRRMKVVITTIPEQQKIANCLSSIDDLITAQAQKIEALKAHKKGLMQQLFPSSDKAGA